MIWPWPPTPIFSADFSGAPPDAAAPPELAAGAVADGGFVAAPLHAVTNTSAMLRTVDLYTSVYPPQAVSSSPAGRGFQRTRRRSSWVTNTSTTTTTTQSTSIPAQTPVASRLPSDWAITWPSPRAAPRYSPTTAPTIAKPTEVCRLVRIHVRAEG